MVSMNDGGLEMKNYNISHQTDISLNRGIGFLRGSEPGVKCGYLD